MGSSNPGRKTFHLRIATAPEPLRRSDLTTSLTAKPRFLSGEVVHVEGSDGYDDLMRLVAHHRGFKTYWVNRDDEISLAEIHSYGVDLTKLTFTTAAKTAHVLKRAIESGLYPILIAPASELPNFERDELKRSAMAAGACVFLINP